MMYVKRIREHKSILPLGLEKSVIFVLATKQIIQFMKYIYTSIHIGIYITCITCTQTALEKHRSTMETVN